MHKSTSHAHAYARTHTHALLPVDLLARSVTPFLHYTPLAPRHLQASQSRHTKDNQGPEVCKVRYARVNPACVLFQPPPVRPPCSVFVFFHQCALSPLVDFKCKQLCHSPLAIAILYCSSRSWRHPRRWGIPTRAQPSFSLGATGVCVCTHKMTLFKKPRDISIHAPPSF